MALYNSNEQYKCERCGNSLFKQEETFLIEQIKDNTKLSSPVVLKRTTTITRIICADGNCNYTVTKDVE